MGGRSPFASILALGVTQIVGYGTLYYSFSILSADMASSLAWPVEWVFAAFSVALLAGGLTAPFAGRWMDMVGAGPIMVVGSCIASAALAACALAPQSAMFVASLVLAEAAANLVQYGAAFALLVQINPRTAQRNITYLTLIAGFASTIFWPITTALHAHLGWQQVYLIFAGLNLLVCLPLHVWLARGARPGIRRNAAPLEAVSGQLHPDLHKLGFKLMVLGFCVQSFVSAAVLVHMVPLLSGLGLGAGASLVGTVFGPAQVLSRLVNMLFGRRLSPLRLAMVSAVFIAAGVAILAATAPSLPGAVAFALIFGMGSGLFSIAVGTLPLALFGSDSYGSRQGKLMAARLTLSSIAPFVFALGMERIGSVFSLALMAMLAAGGCGAFIRIGSLARGHAARPVTDPATAS